MDRVRAATQQRQRRAGLAGVGRLAEDRAVEDDDRIGGDDHGIRVTLGQAVRLLAREPLGVRHRLFAGMQRLVDVGRIDVVLDPDEREQLSAARGLRRENHVHRHARAHFSNQSVTGPSFTSSTSIIAPNSPVSTVSPRSRSARTNPS